MVDFINDFKHSFIQHAQPVYENPSPGNQAGGISPLADKSLGCTQPAGISPVPDVLKYGEVLQTNALPLMSSPGTHVIPSSALAAAGLHLHKLSACNLRDI
ncbi:UxaA family hydrolase [Bacillus mojavensis]|nr:UxaA family hydrolase [Bacillus mojavensis]